MKVAIVGTAPYDEPVPFGDPDWDIWGLNDGYRQFPDDSLPAFTAWWEIHGDTPLTRRRRPLDHFERVAGMGIPLYYLHGDPPNSHAIRLDVDMLAAVGRDYFACTMAYQMAMALLKGAEEIALYGIALMGAREAVVERPCVSYWIGLAEGRGVPVRVYHRQPTGLMRYPHRYAYHDKQEREDAYWIVTGLAQAMNHWLPDEAERISGTRWS
jgi:hypothetical protein